MLSLTSTHAISSLLTLTTLLNYSLASVAHLPVARQAAPATTTSPATTTTTSTTTNTYSTTVTFYLPLDPLASTTSILPPNAAFTVVLFPFSPMDTVIASALASAMYGSGSGTDAATAKTTTSSGSPLDGLFASDFSTVSGAVVTTISNANANANATGATNGTTFAASTQIIPPASLTTMSSKASSTAAKSAVATPSGNVAARSYVQGAGVLLGALAAVMVAF